MKTITINVTKEDIARGRPRRPNSCPVALATQRALDASVSAGCIAVTGIECSILEEHGEYSYYALPDSARAFIKNFDNEKPGKPFRFAMKKSS